MAEENYELIEHTADIGIRVKAEDLKGVFRKAASAMFDIIAEAKTQRHKDTKTPAEKFVIEQKADNVEELFVNWLNELLSLSSAKEVIFSDFAIHFIDEKGIKATAIGQSAKAFKSNVEIKAATYHQLKVALAAGQWQAEVIFDV